MEAPLVVVSFDVWNTLLDLGLVYEKLAELLARIMGVEASEAHRVLVEAGREARRRRRVEGYASHEPSLRLLAERAGVGITVLYNVLAEVMAGLDEAAVLPGAREALLDARGRGFKVVAASNILFWPGLLSRVALARAGLLGLLDATFFADELGVVKPSREFFERVAAGAGGSLGELVHVGDRVDEDFGGALAAGATAVLVNPRLGGKTVLAVHPRAYAVGSLELLPKVLDMVEERMRGKKGG